MEAGYTQVALHWLLVPFIPEQPPPEQPFLGGAKHPLRLPQRPPSSRCWACVGPRAPFLPRPWLPSRLLASAPPWSVGTSPRPGERCHERLRGCLPPRSTRSPDVRGGRACRCLMRTSSPCVPFSVKAVTLPSKQLARPPGQSKGVPRRAVPACAGLPSGAHLLRPTLLGAAPHVAGSCAWFNGPGKGSFSPSQPAACVTALTFISATLIGWHV